MINFLNEHFVALSILFLLTLSIVLQWREKHAKVHSLDHTSANSSWYEMYFWLKVIAVLQSMILLFAILNYFKS